MCITHWTQEPLSIKINAFHFPVEGFRCDHNISIQVHCQKHFHYHLYKFTAVLWPRAEWYIFALLCYFIFHFSNSQIGTINGRSFVCFLTKALFELSTQIILQLVRVRLETRRVGKCYCVWSCTFTVSTSFWILDTVEDEYIVWQRGGGGGGGNYHPPPLPLLARTMTAIMISSQTCRLVLFLVMLVKLPYCLNH